MILTTTDEKILEMLVQMQGRMGALAEDISGLKAGVSGIKPRLGIDVGKKLQPLAEGQTILKDRLDVLQLPSTV